MNAVRRLNPGVPVQGLEEAVRKVLNISSPSLVDANHEFHHYLVNGVSVEYLRPDGTVGYDPVRLVDFGSVEANDWAAVNQFTVISPGHRRRPDIVVFINGLPLQYPRRRPRRLGGGNTARLPKTRAEAPPDVNTEAGAADRFKEPGEAYAVHLGKEVSRFNSRAPERWAEQ